MHLYELHTCFALISSALPGGGGGRRARVLYADSPPPPPSPPPWKLAPKCRTISAKGALRQICLNH